eukprot:23146-Chlamydomonas_euryale.AAC.3
MDRYGERRRNQQARQGKKWAAKCIAELTLHATEHGLPTAPSNSAVFVPTCPASKPPTLSHLVLDEQRELRLGVQSPPARTAAPTRPHSSPP